MKASDVVTTATQRRESASGIAHTETADAVNTGIVGAADKSASALKGADANDVAQPGKGKGGTGARLARHAVGGALSGSELEGVDNMAYTAYYGAKGAKAAGRAAKGFVERHIGDEESKEAARAAHEAHKAGRGMRMRHRLGQTARGAVSSALQGSELERMDDVVYSSYHGAKAAKKGVQKGAQAARQAAAKLKAKQAARTQAKMQAKRHQMEAIARHQAAQTAAKGAAASAGAASAGTAASAGAGGAAAAAGGTGAAAASPVLLIFFLVLIIIIVIVAIIAGAFAGNEASTGSLTGNEAVIAQYLKNKDLEDVQIAAIMGNMSKESGMDPNSLNTSSGAFGICNWLGDRKTALFELCDSRGKPHNDLATQLDFFWEEFTMARPGGWNSRTPYNEFMACTDDADLELAVEIFCRNFERCGEDEADYPKRNSEARRILSALRSGGGGAIASVGDLQWPSNTPQWSTYARHWGLDIPAPLGSPIYAPADGTVIWAGWSWESTYGNIVRIYHDGLGLQTACAHMSNIAVSNGDHVTKGQVIGYTGSTGNSTGPHVHFEIYERNSADIGGVSIKDDLNMWSKYFDRGALEANRI